MLSIYELDSGNCVTNLHAGEHVFGRGKLLKCYDGKVSRKHGMFKVTEKEATITSLHNNPCFYQLANSTHLIILTKDMSHQICSGDKFALLSNIWFTLKYVPVNEEQTQSLTQVTGEGEELSDDEAVGQTQALTQVTCEGEEMYEGDKMSVCEEMSENEAVGKHASSQGNSKLITDAGGACENNGTLSNSTAVQKSRTSSDVTLPPWLKRTKLDWDEKLKQRNVFSVNAAETFINHAEDDNECDKNGLEETTPINGERNDKRPHEDNYESNTKFKEKDDDDNYESNKKFKEEDNVEIRETVNQTTEVLSDSGEEDDDVMDGVGQNVQLQPTDTTVESGGNKENAKVDSTVNDGPENDVNAPSTSESSSKDKTRRDRCWYGAKCYRKNPNHKKELSHPGDSDYNSDPNDDRPSCVYGAECYRKNKEHRTNYKHPRATVKQTRKKRNKKKPDGKVTKKAPKNDESSEDDYDFEDPFIDDGSEDEYEEESESEDSDSEWNPDGDDNDDEDTKRLLREAKRFTKDSKNQKD